MSQQPVQPSLTTAADSLRWLEGGGDMGARMRTLDWAGHPLGPLQTWPQSLRSAVSICLGSRLPMAVFWGPGLVMLYNDAYAPLLGDKHPGALGRSIHEVWTEVADVIAPLMASVMTTGEATWIPDGDLAPGRHGAAEDAHCSHSFGPVRVEDGSVGGLLAVAMETTQRIVGERRLACPTPRAGASDAAAITGSTPVSMPASIPGSTPGSVAEPSEGFDVNAQRRAEVALAAALQQTEGQRRLYEAILANTPDLAYVFDLSHRFVYANEVLLRMWGKTWHEAIGKNCLELGYEPWHAAMHDEEIDRVVATCQPVRGEVPFAGAFGRRIYDYIFVPVLGPDGEVTAVAGTTRDITEIKAMEETLRSQAEQLRENDQRKDEFLGILAHELRNPLAPLKNGLEVFRRLAPRDEPALQRVLGMMDRQLAQMVRLIDDLLDVTRISSGKIRMSRSRLPLAEVIQAAVETSQPAIDQPGHTLSVTAPGRPVFVEADATRLAQVFSNLLTNAAKFTPPGGHLQITTERQGGEVVVTVRDDGEGIPPDMLSRIFEMFVQVDRSMERERSGLGIGLSLAKGLVALHDGSIEARSDGPGRGSEFIVRLPAAADAERPADVDAGPAGPDTFAGRRVLIADDNVDAADSLALLFELMGSSPRIARDGLDAVAQAERFQPELVLLDLGMPGLDGFEACARIKATPWGRDMVVVALTGWGQEKDRRQSREAGFDGHLVKPVSAEAIRALMASIDPAPSDDTPPPLVASPDAGHSAT